MKPNRARLQRELTRSLQIESLEGRELLAADFRTIDGSGNNQSPGRTDWGAADTNLIRFGYPGEYPDGFGDQIETAPNPRTVSNAISSQAEPVYDDRNLSDWHVQWGQFLTHDLDLTGTSAGNNVLLNGQTGDFTIPVDSNDILGPSGIPFNRSNYDPDTGDARTIGGGGPGQPPGRPNWREQINEITSYIDASNVYGSDEVRAAALRTFVDGKLETTAGGLLPGLNDAGEENDNPLRHDSSELFLAGDVRANEQIGLTATHALFVREHNRLADLIKLNNPTLNDEEIYQWARKIVGAEMQIITYEEYLPAVMGNSAPNPEAYAYSNTVDASITNSFAASFFRFGHSQQSSTLQLVNNDGSSAGEFSLASIFFNPDLLKEDPALAEQVLKGLASQVAQEVDTLIVDEVRNFLFGAPGAGGMDLAALDIQRGRDHGLVDYNEARRAYNLFSYNNFNQITSDTELSATLQSLYGNNINRIDSWVGALSEDHLPGKSIGPMLNASLIDQFTRLRDGDRYFYTGDVDLQDPIVTQVIDLDNLTLASVIRNNTSITNIQDNVFIAAAGFRVTSEANIEVDESGASTGSFDVVLTKRPASNVVFTLQSSDSTESSPQSNTLVFTPENWSTPQAVTVFGVDDAQSDGPQASAIIVSVNSALSDNEFVGLADQSVEVTTTDDDLPDLVIQETGNGTTVGEDGVADTFNVQLRTQPSSNVVIEILVSNNQATVDESTLTFSTSNWDVAQTVTVSAVDNHRIDGARDAVIQISVDQAASADEYDSVSTDSIEVEILDDDLPGILLVESDDGTQVSEAGDQDSIFVTLAAEPASNVTLQVAADDAEQVSVENAVLVFTTANWDTPQEVHLSAIDDLSLDGDTSTFVRVAVNPTASDPAFAEAQGKSVAVTALDNDLAAFSLDHTDGTTEVSEGGDSDTVQVRLDRRPLSDVVIALSIADSEVAELESDRFVFTPENWDVPQSTQVEASQEDILDGLQSVSLVASVVVNESNATFAEVADQSLLVSVADDDVPTLIVESTDGSNQVSESGNTDELNVRLARQPLGSVAISLTSDDLSELTLSTTTLIYDAANWSQFQTITLQGENDDLLDGDAFANVRLEVIPDASQDLWDSMQPTDVAVTILDDDLGEVLISESDGSTRVSERGQQDQLSITLSAQPNSLVSVDISAVLGEDEITLDRTNLTFGPDNWDEPQTVLVTGRDDRVADGDAQVTVLAQVDAGLSDDAFDNASANVNIINADDPFEINIAAGQLQILEKVGGAIVADVEATSATHPDPELSVSHEKFLFEASALRLADNGYLLYADTTTIELVVTATHPTDSTIQQSENFLFTVLENEAPSRNHDSLDVNNDLSYSSIDALLVINLLNQGGHSDQSINYAQADGTLIYPDTSGDRILSALDALLVINALNSPAGAGEDRADNPKQSHRTDLYFDIPDDKDENPLEDEEALLMLLAANSILRP